MLETYTEAIPNGYARQKLDISTYDYIIYCIEVLTAELRLVIL